MLGAGGCLWGFSAGLRALLGGSHAGLLPCGARTLHGSPVPCGKNLLKKFASKTKKKFWYEGPSLGSHLVSRGTAVNPLRVLKCTRFQKSTELQPESPSVPISERTVSGGVGLDELTYKQSQLEFLTKSTSKKTKKEDSVRLRVLNGLLHRALGDLLCTPEVGQDVYDLNVELSKVSLTSDFSACRVYWRTTPSAEQNAETQATLQRYAAYMRHLLMSQQTVRNMPPIVFVQDKEHASLAEVDRLLAVADLERPDKKEDLTESDLRDPETPDVPSPRDTLGPAVHSSLCGIDHEALNKQIMEYKRRKEKRHGVEIPACPGPEQVAELRRQMKRRKKARPRMDDELSPKNYLWGVVSDSDPDDSRVFREELTLHMSGSPRKQNRN